MHPTAFLLSVLLPAAAAMPLEEQMRAVRAAWIAERMGNVAASQRLFTEALATWPDDPYLVDETLRFLDRTGGDAELTARLRARLDAALADPERPLPVPLVRRRVLDRTTQPAELEAIRTSVAQRLARQPSDGDLLEVLAAVQRRVRDDAGLASSLDRLAAVRPSPTLDWERLVLAQRAGRWKDAKGLLDAIEKTGPPPELVRWARLPIVAHLEGVDACLAAAGDPGDPEDRAVVTRALMDIGWEQWDAGNEAAAEKLFRKAQALAPQLPEASRVVATLFGEPDTEAGWSAVGDPTKLLHEGSTRLIAGDAAGAYDLLQRAAADLPKEPIAWYNLGLAAKALERYDQAVQALERALALRPDWAPALRALAEAQGKAGACEEALATAQRAIDADPRHPDPYVTLFHCHQSLGDTKAAEAAKAAYERLKAAAGP